MIHSGDNNKDKKEINRIGGQGDSDPPAPDRSILPRVGIHPKKGEKSAPNPSGVVSREEGLEILVFQASMTEMKYQEKLTEAEVREAILRERISVCESEISALKKRVAALQREKINTMRGAFLREKLDRVKEIGFEDGKRIDEMPDGRFRLSTPPPQRR